MKHARLPFRVHLALIWAHMALIWEQLLSLLFPAALFPLCFAGLALTGLFDVTGDPLRLACLLIALFGFAGFVWRKRHALHWPDRHAVVRRAESDGHVPAGLLFDLQDRPARTGEDSTDLWSGHVARGRDRAARLAMQSPHAVWTRQDRYGLRAGVLLLFFVGMVWAGSGAGARLQSAIAPYWLAAGSSGVRVEAWLEPPQYSGLPPRFLGEEPGQSIQALPGSELFVRVSGTRRGSVLRLTGSRKPVRLKQLDQQIHEGRVMLTQNGMVRLRGGASASWQYLARVDEKPKIAFAKSPDVSAQGELELPIAASDDFGVQKIHLLLETGAPGHFNKSQQVDVPFTPGKTVSQTISLDLTKNVLAGLPVTMHLQAVDGAGQVSVSAPVQMKLPEKLFINPWAAAFAEQRLLLKRDDRPYTNAQPQKDPTPTIWLGSAKVSTESTFARLRQAPKGVERAARLQRALMRAPEQGIEDPMIWLGLSYVNARMLAARSQTDLAGLPADLWEMALRAEGGEVESAAAAMRLAEQALQTGLLLGAPPSDLKRLNDRYEKAVQRYLKALAEQALKEGKSNDGGGNAMANMSGDQLQEMLDALKQLNETGARDDARRLLKALSQLLANMRMQLANGGQGGNGDDPVSKAMRQALEELGELMGKQRELMDQAQRAENQAREQGGQPSQNGQQQSGAGQEGNQKGDNPAPGDRQLQADQQGLGGELRDLQQGGGVSGQQAQDDLAAAGKAMDRAAKAFGEGDRQTAMEEGGKAMGELRQGAQSLAGDLMQRREGQNGQRDPFGRRADGGMNSGDGPAVPDKIDPERARKILQELRNRAADQSRPREEREYLQRLLERF